MIWHLTAISTWDTDEMTFFQMIQNVRSIDLNFKILGDKIKINPNFKDFI